MPLKKWLGGMRSTFCGIVAFVALACVRCASAELAAVDSQFTASCRERAVTYEAFLVELGSRYEACWGREYGPQILEALGVSEYCARNPPGTSSPELCALRSVGSSSE